MPAVGDEYEGNMGDEERGAGQGSSSIEVKGQRALHNCGE